MEKNYKKVLIQGDEVPKVNMICDVLHEGLRVEFRDVHNRNKKNIRLQHCNTVSFIEYNDVLDIYSSLIPYGIVMYMFFTESKVDMKNYDQVVYLEPYPFTLGEKIRAELDEVKNYVKLNSMIQFKIMFYRNLNQKSGVGDIIGIEQALKEAPDYIKANIYDNSILDVVEYCVYRTPKDLIKMVHGGFGNLSVLVAACTERFMQYTARISSNHFFSEYGDYKEVLEFKNYDKYACLLDVNEINKLTKFVNVKGSDDVVKSYVKNYILKFQDLLMDLLEEVYTDIIRGICFWDLDKDISNLKEGAKKLIQKSLMNFSNTEKKCPQFESDYNEEIRNVLKLDTLFEERVISLVNREMMEYLHEYFIRKEKLLSKTFLCGFDNGDRL